MRQTRSSGFLTVRFKPACSAKETSWKIKMSLEASSDVMLSKRQITKAQIGQRGSAPLLFEPPAPKTSFLASRAINTITCHVFCLDGLSVQRSKSKFLGTLNTYTSLNAQRLTKDRMHSLHAQIQEFLSGERVQARWLENSLDNFFVVVFFGPQFILQFTKGVQWFCYRKN